MKKISNNYIASLIILSISILTSILFFLLASGFDYLQKVENRGWYFLLYIFLSFASYQLDSKFKNKFTEILYSIICLPFAIIYVFLQVALPIMSLQLHLLFYILFACTIPLVIYNLNETYHFIQLTTQTFVYLILTISSITAILFNLPLKKFIYSISPMRPSSSEKMKKFRLVELNDYLLTENNLRFIIYFFYFTYLIVLNINSFEGVTLYGNEFIDKAVLQSFITFVAFDRVLTNFRQSEFKPTEFLNRIFNSISRKNE